MILFIFLKILNIGKSINFIRHVCQDRSPIRGGDEKALEYSRAHETSGTYTLYCKTDLNLISLHCLNIFSCKLVMRMLNCITKFSKPFEICFTQQVELCFLTWKVCVYVKSKCIHNWPLPIGAFQDQCKQTMIN